LRGKLERLQKKFADAELIGLLRPSDQEQLDLHVRHTQSLIRKAEAQGCRQDAQAFATMERAELWVTRIAEAQRRSGNLKKQATVAPRLVFEAESYNAFLQEHPEHKKRPSAGLIEKQVFSKLKGTEHEVSWDQFHGRDVPALRKLGLIPRL
jgi:hypothetical protein